MLRRYWDRLVIVRRSSDYRREPLKRYWGVTHGYPLPPTIFNMLVDAALWNWMIEVYMGRSGTGWVWEGGQEDIQLFLCGRWTPGLYEGGGNPDGIQRVDIHN